VLVLLLLIPGMQVAVVRLTRSLPFTRPLGLPIYVARLPSTPFINPPGTLPMWIDQVSSSGPKTPLCYRWIPLAQIPEIFLKHLWISEEDFGRGQSLLLTLPLAPALPSTQALEELAVDDRRWNDA
jgi:hypothetical protein